MLHTGPHRPVDFLAKRANTLGDLFRRRASASAERPAIYAKESETWQPVTWRGFYRQASMVGGGLRALGLELGDRVAILGPTQAPWAYFDMGAQLAGMVSLGIYPKQAVEQVRYLLEHSEARVIFVHGDDELETVVAAAEGLASLVAIVPWERATYERWADRESRITSPQKFAEQEMDESDVDEVQSEIDPASTAILVYTSGTTGPPKGAMISHRNILAFLASQHDVLPIYEDDLSLNFLPMAHAAERVMGFYGRINGGVATAYASSMATVLTELQEVRPTLFGSVPRLFEKAYGKIHSEIDQKPPVVQKIFAFASGVAREAAAYLVEDRPLPLGLRLKYALADRLVFAKVRAAFGGRVRWFVTGAAPIAMDILEFFWGAGLTIYEVYGMTEATVVTHGNRPGSVKLGTVGCLAKGMEHKIADDGEILLRGPFVFRGYFKNEEATSATIVDDWLHTGDIGTIDADGFLRITDRKKHLIITAGGKNLAPANIENAIKNQDPLISQVHAHGDKRAYVSALVAPSPIETLEWGQARGLVTAEELEARTKELLANPSGRTDALNRATAKIVKHDEYCERIVKAVQAGNKELAQVEQVRRFTILDRDFSQEHGELTPTMKLKRRSIETNYATVLDRVYQDAEFALSP